MQRVFAMIPRFANLDANVLITGECGTGKGLVARTLHAWGPCRDTPLVRVHCAALALANDGGGAAGTALETLPDGGTLLMDEVSDLPDFAQIRLLMLLENQKGGGAAGCPVRVISTSRGDLAARVRQGKFREDLHYRLKGVTIPLPPLRHRRKDIPLLARRFLGEAASAKSLSEEVTAIFQAHDWPGNVRQLKNIVAHAAAVCTGAVILPEHLPAGFPATRPAAGNHEVCTTGGIGRAEILDALQATRWHKSKAAKRLGISRSTFYRKMGELGIS